MNSNQSAFLNSQETTVAWGNCQHSVHPKDTTPLEEPIGPTEFARFQPLKSFGGKLRVPVELALAAHDGRANRSGGMKPFEANLTASLPRGLAVETTASHPAPDVSNRGEIKSTLPR